MASGIYIGRDLIDVNYHSLPFVLGNINVRVASLPRTSEELNSEVRS